MLINGSDSMPYETIDLSMAGASLPPGGYIVVGSATALAMVTGSPLMIMIGASNQVQNGGPDGIAIYDTTSMSVLDALSYEGAITAAQIDGMTFNLVEGTMSSAEDNNSDPGSLVRFPNGEDTDDASSDWVFTSCITPGAANMSVPTGGCP